ncbi:hypothetical protein ACH5RR_036182 [Cinchona calisaya]|uniref:Uncharacterized protein n=1 Tax=Cinchona calisaya TaxID=153742 RepID=A0ABD2Y2L9_9GENT
MAVDVCSEVASLVVSPRISFSHDLKEADGMPLECHRRSDAFLLESIDFNFCISRSLSQELHSSADELFANGKIVPAEVKKTTTKYNKETPSKEILRSKPISSCYRRDTSFKSIAATTSARSDNPEVALNFDTKKKSLKEFLAINPESDAETEEERKPSSKPFWQFRKSSSLNLDSCKSNTLIRSLHFLSRSNSTGSAPNTKPSPQPKVMQKQHSQKDQATLAKQTNSHVRTSSGHYSYSCNSYRSPSRKNYGNGIRIGPVLNIPHACISKGTSSLFGFGSLFCNGKSKKKKKCNY